MSEKREKWIQRVNEKSDVLDLEKGIFKKDDPREIALSLKKSAEKSSRRKSSPYQAAMSMLSFYINRAGDQLSQSRRKTLEKAKDELRDIFGRSA